jgi:TAP-like protein
LSDARDDSGFSFALFFSITCSEDIRFIREDEVAGKAKGTFLGDYRVRQQQAARRQWPKASLPKRYRDPVRSSVPTVFASGDTDGGTPLWFMEHAAKGFSHRLEVVLRGQGHTEWNECIAKIYQEVVISGSVGGGGTSSCPAGAIAAIQIAVAVLLIARRFTGRFANAGGQRANQKFRFSRA